MTLVRATLLALASCAAAIAPAQAGDVIVVSGGGFALQEAIDAAAEGDTLLVAPGSYFAAFVTAKSLSLVADPPGGVTLTVGLRVSNLGAGQRCTVSGLNVAGGSPAIEIANDAGSVRLQSIQATSSSGYDGALVSSSGDVAFVRCNIQGGAQPTGGSGTPPPSGTGLASSASQVALYDCAITGGRGRDGLITGSPLGIQPAGAGGVGARMSGGSIAFARGSSITGGAGGNGTSLFCHPLAALGPTQGAAGGVGLEVDASSSVNAIDCTTQGGAGGIGGAGGGPCTPGGPTYPPAADGATGAAVAGNASVQAGAHLTFVAPPTVREGQSLALTVTGTLGDTAYLAISTQSRWALDLAFGGVFLFGPMARRVVLGTIPGSGTLSTNPPVAQLPAGVQADLRFLQFVARNPTSGQVELGSPSALTILDSAF